VDKLGAKIKTDLKISANQAYLLSRDYPEKPDHYRKVALT
jgi:hypothetical protein